METLESIRRRIQSAQDLYGIVRTMKALAAASIRQFERSVEAVEAYNRTVETGLRIVLQEQAAPPEERAPRQQAERLAIIFGSDQGMCGQFNENIVSFASRDIEETSGEKGQPAQMVVGLRAALLLEESRGIIQEQFSVPSSVVGINPAVQSLLLRINHWREEQEVERVTLYYNRPGSGASYQPVRMQLIPVDMSLFQGSIKELCPSRSLPMYTLERERLLAALLRQYLFVQLFRAYAESLASENASRLMTMQAAEKNIQERLGELNAIYHSRRQDSITSELLEIISGFEVLSGEE
jgi:F-type H+-transporting ATPase subunit gamma